MKMKKEYFFNLTIASLLVYIISWISFKEFKAQLFYFPFALSGLLLFFYLPGRNLNRSLNITLPPDRFIRLAVSITSSIATIGMGTILLKGIIGFSEIKNILFILILNVILFLSSIKFYKSKEKIEEFKPISLILLLPLIFFIIRSALNPYLVDQDGAKYIYIMEKITEFKSDGSFLASSRYLFSYLLVSLHYITDISFLNILKFVLPSFLWMSFASLGILSLGLKNKFSYVLPLLILSSPAFIGHIDRFKPEDFVYMLGLPAIIFFVQSITKKSYAAYALGLIYALVVSRIHETGLIFLLIYFFSSFVLLFANQEKLKPFITKKNFLLLIIVITPYLILFKVNLMISFFISGVASLGTFNGLHLRLWFLNNLTASGANLSWPSWTFIIYYAFNGALIIFFSLITLLRKGHKIGPITPGIIGIIIFFVIAEILPRMGIYLLPDRAIVQLFFYSVIVLVYFAPYIHTIIDNGWRKIIISTLYLNIISSVFVSTLLVVNSGSLVSRSEGGVIKKLNNDIQENAVVLSTQSLNEALVEVYGGKQFINFKLPKDLNDNNLTVNSLRDYLNNAISNGEIVKSDKVSPTIIDTVSTEKVHETLQAYDSGIFVLQTSISRTKEKKKDESNNNKIETDQPVYLLYSFAKIDGLLNKFGRNYIKNSLDAEDSNMFKRFLTEQDASVVYKDESSILIRVR